MIPVDFWTFIDHFYRQWFTFSFFKIFFLRLVMTSLEHFNRQSLFNWINNWIYDIAVEIIEELNLLTIFG